MAAVLKVVLLVTSLHMFAPDIAVLRSQTIRGVEHCDVTIWLKNEPRLYTVMLCCSKIMRENVVWF